MYEYSIVKKYKKILNFVNKCMDGWMDGWIEENKTGFIIDDLLAIVLTNTTITTRKIDRVRERKYYNRLNTFSDKQNLVK